MNTNNSSNIKITETDIKSDILKEFKTSSDKSNVITIKIK